MQAPPSLEELFTQDFGVSKPTALQRAICRIADGQKLGELRDHPDVVAAIGELPSVRCIPRTMLLLCAIRGGKSLLAGAAGIRCGLTADTSPCGPGDVPRVAILSTKKDEAKVIMDHLLGAFRMSPRLSGLLVKPPTADTITFKHPSGRPIEIKVVAGSRAGTSLAARWLVAVIFDEAAKMVGSEAGVVNLDDERHNVAGRRLLSGCASEWLISSPWAPFGPIYQEVTDHWGHASPDMVVVRASGEKLNPSWWTPERAEELKRTNPDAYRTDFLAEFVDPESALIAGVHIDASRRFDPLDLIPDPHADRYEYAAEIDPATRGNAWTLIVTKMVGKRSVVCLAREWKGTKVKPLNSRTVLAEIAALLAPFKVAHSDEGRKRIGSDQLGIDMLRELGREVALDIIEYPATRASNNEGYIELARRFEQGEIEIPNVPNLISDLRRLRRVTTVNSFYIDLPVTSDGRHCDYAPALMRACQRQTYQPPAPDQRPQWKIEQEETFKRVQAKYGRKQQGPWWKRAP